MREEKSGLEIVPNPELGPIAWPKNGWPIDGNHETCLVWEVDRIVSAPYIIPQISAHITALSRIRLFYGMTEVAAQGAGPIYVDTDSVYYDRHRAGCNNHKKCKGCAGIPESKQLGGWKIETPPDELVSGDWVLPKLYQQQFHKIDCMWTLFGFGEPCGGCSMTQHEPSCRKSKWKCTDKECARLHDDPVFTCRECNGEVEKVKCKGCAVTKQKMKGVGGRIQTAENWDRMVNDGLPVFGDRLSAFRTMLNTVTSADRIDLRNHDEGVLLSPVLVPYSKSVRTRYDKRQLLADGSTRAVHVH